MNITNIKNQIKYYKNKYGIKQTIKKCFNKIWMKIKFIFKNRDIYGMDDYHRWIYFNEPTKKEIEEQRKEVFKFQPKISIIVPMYNTPIKFFKELVDNMIGQTYTNWELCLADGSEKKNEEIKNIVKKDERIKYKFLNENKGISSNTNQALKLATGDYIALLDHDDLLPVFSLYEVVKTINENPDVEFIYTDEDKCTNINNRYDPHFKPDFAIDTLRSVNYICHFSIFKKELIDRLKGFKTEFDGAQDYDMFLRMSENTKKIVHIPKILYHWRVHPNSTAATTAGDAKPYAFQAGKRAIEAHLERCGLKGIVEYGVSLGIYRVIYNVVEEKKVSIIIPNMDHIEVLKVCINSIIEKTTYKNYEIIIVENNSKKEETFEYYKQIEKNEKIKIVYYEEKKFNYSKIINFGVKQSTGEYIIQLNNDTELITPNWLEELVGYAQRKDIGAVGVKLYYPDNTIQHNGVIIGIGGVGGHILKNLPKDKRGYFARDSFVQNLSAVTAACIISRKEIYEEVGYMDEKFEVAFNDLDFCLKIREKGYLIAIDPFVELIHYESKSRGYEDTEEKRKRFQGEINRFKEKWNTILEKGDPYFNPNFRLDIEDYKIKND
ncbi:MAG: glycosyltransferase family 2 protein [Clostridiaceae bacterium]|nr:glycosyltransferase family 2 protein [Clostridiaceae bacterium]